MKRTVAFILAVLMLAGSVSALTSCRRVKGGGEAARLLLANERLDERVIGGGVDVGLLPAEPTASLTDRIVSLTSLSEDRAELNSAAIDKAYTWSAEEFDPYYGSVAQYASFILNIENHASIFAGEIAYMKQNVGIVDKWVDAAYGKQLLRVEESRDVLITVDSNGDLTVGYRYTNEEAVNVYELITLSTFENGETGMIRTVFIPGLYYEYSYVNSNGFEDFVIMDNSRGYWVGTRYNYTVMEDISVQSVYADAIAIRGETVFTTALSAEASIGENAELEVMSTSVGELATGAMILNVGRFLGSDSYAFTVDVGSIREGLVSLGADEAYDISGKAHSSAVNCIETVKGVIHADPESTDPISFYSGDVNYRSEPTVEAYTGSLLFCGRDFSSLADALTAFYGYMEEKGIRLALGRDETLDALNSAEVFGNSFGDIFVWNGYNMRSISDVIMAKAVFTAQCEQARSIYESVKDNGTAEGRQRLSSFASFDKLSDVVMGSNLYSEGVVTLEGVGAVIKDGDLLEEGRGYLLRVAVALTDENGNPIAVNTLPLAGGESDVTVYNGGSLSLVARGSYTLPKNLNSGNYALVVYAAEAEGGIRVTEMQKISGFSATEQKLDSSAMDITVISREQALYVNYAIKNSFTFSIETGAESYTREELVRIMKVEVLKHGAPHSGAILEYKTGEAVTEDGLSAGEYRLLCYLQTADGLAESYVYLTLV